MKHITQRVVALFLIFILVLGMTMQSYAETAEGTDTVFKRVNLAFDDALEANQFSGNYWSVQNGTLKEGTAWGTTYLMQQLPLSENLTVSFDIYIDYTNSWADSLFGFGFMNSDQTKGTFGWIQRSQYGDLLTWRKDGVNGPTSNVGVGDQIVRSKTQVDGGNTVFGSVHNVEISLKDNNMTVYVDGATMTCTNGKSLTCDITEGYFTLRATNTSAYIDDLRIVKDGVADDYRESFTDISAFNKTGAVTVDTANKKIIGSGWSGIAYKLPAENYRLDMTVKLNAEVSGANENRLYFGLPSITTTNGAGGYLLHFYNNETYLFDNSIVRNGWYDNNAIISKCTTASSFQNDDKEHKLTVCVYDDQFYMMIDGMFFIYNSDEATNVYTAAESLGEGYIYFIGSEWEVSQFDITCFGGAADVARAHFSGLHSIYETIENLDESCYSTYSWSKIEGIRDEYIRKMDAVKDGSNAEAVTELAKEAVEKITAVPRKAIVEESVVGENQVLIGYIISGGDYNGGLYNFEVGDELPEGEDITLEPVVATMYMEKGASVRLGEGAGIRWKTNIAKEDYERLIALGATFGTRVTSTGSDKYVNITLDKGLHTDSSDYYYIASLINIKEGNYTRVFQGCGYVSVTYADGTTDTKAAVDNENKRTYKYLVTKAYTDVSETANDEYVTAVEKDGRTVYTPYTSGQYAFLENVYKNILGQETTGEGTTAQVHILNVSGGEEVTAAGRAGSALSVLITYEDKTVLIDAGVSQTQEIVGDYLKAQGIERLDYLIVTHAHEDHIGGVPYIINNFDVGTLIYKEPDWNVTGTSEDKSLYTAMITAAEAKVNSDNTTVTFTQPDEEGYKVVLGADTYFRIFNCTAVFDEKKQTDLNYYSLQTYFVSGTAKAFFASDSVGLYQNKGLLNYIGKVDLYQAQHHGQGSPYSPEALLKVLQPKATVATTTWNSPYIVETMNTCAEYGRYYITGSDGHLVFENTNGSFELKADEESRWTSAQKVTIEETELEYINSRRQGTDGNAVSGGRYVIAGKTTGTALVLHVPDNMTQPAIINFEKGQYVYSDTTGLRFRIVLNDRVLYDSDVSGLDGDAVALRFTVKAGDKLYFIAEGAAETVTMPVSMTINGKYFCVDHANNIDPANGKNAVSKNFFGGVSDKGTYYTCEELLSYMSVIVTDVQ